jgi:heme a synthase
MAFSHPVATTWHLPFALQDAYRARDPEKQAGRSYRNVTTASLSGSAKVSQEHRLRGARAFRLWLLLLIALVLVMVTVGGATRLTGSGLSITEWKPITGAIPPLSAADWAKEFELYRASPQYKLQNAGMSLAEFQFIYWWEWGHRQLGRFIGLVMLGGFLAFWAAGVIRGRMVILTFGLGLLLALQGTIGWIMVASGLQPGMVAVAPVKLTLHLTFACLFFIGLVVMASRWGAFGAQKPGTAGLKRAAWALALAVLAQIALGGLVAGSKAGFTYNSWPLMDGALVPPLEHLLKVKPFWENFVDNPTMVQFNHRVGAYLLLGLAIWHAVAARGTAVAPFARMLAALVLLQGVMGIVTLLLVVPLWAGLAHQALAMFVLLAAVIHAMRMAPVSVSAQESTSP